MKNIVACYKWVFDEKDIRLKDDDTADFSKATRKISGYDRNAIQAAAEIAGQTGGRAYGLSVGDASTKKSVKEALSRGLDELVWVNVGAEALRDSAQTAEVLAAAIEDMEDVGLVICAEGSSDQFARQTAPRIAAQLGWPVVTCVSRIVVEDDLLRATRTLESETEEVEAGLPAVVSVLPEVAELSIPTLKQIMEARGKPSWERALADVASDVGPRAVVEGLMGCKSNRKNMVFEGDDAVKRLVAALRKEGVLG